VSFTTHNHPIISLDLITTIKESIRQQIDVFILWTAVKVGPKEEGGY